MSTPTELDMDVLLNRLDGLLDRIDAMGIPGGPSPKATEKTLIYDVSEDKMRPITQAEVDSMAASMRCHWTFQAIMNKATIKPNKVKEVLDDLIEIEKKLRDRKDHYA